MDEQTLEEMEREQALARAKQAVVWARVVAGFALLVGIGLLLSGRSLWWHLVGYICSAVFATSAAAFAARQAGLLLQPDEKASVGRVVVFNIVCLAVAFVHMLYVARRFW